MKIGIIGSGSWGTAMAVLLSKKGYTVSLWSYFKEESDNLARNRENKPYLPGVMLPDTVSCTNSMEECARGADVVITAVPSHTMAATAANLAPYITQGQRIVNISKGFDEGSLKRLSEVIEQYIPQAVVSVMSGPSHAEEVSRSLPTTNVIANREWRVAEEIQDIFMMDCFRIYTSTDVVGVELGGALKNVIALAAGISDGLGFEDNTKAALMTRGMAEIKRLGVAMGGKESTFAGLSGIGDLIVTCTSMHSRNRRAGILIGQGRTPEEAQAEVKMVVEGVRTCRSAYKLAKQYGVEMPIVSAMYQVLFEHFPVKETVGMLMQRSKRREEEELWSL